MLNKWKIGALVCVALFGLLLRLNKFAQVPPPGLSLDEYSNAFVGLSIITNGIPVGMTGVDGNKVRFKAYINPDLVYQETANGDPMTLAYPWFDHPPLVGLVTGSYAYIKGARVFEDVRAVVVRKPVVILSGMTIFLVGFYFATVFGFSYGLLAALLYAVSPLITIANRMVQAENFTTPLGLVILILSTYKFNFKKLKYWIFLVATLLALTKLSGVAFVLGSSLILKKNSNQDWLWPIYGFTFGILLWVVYGNILSTSDFWAVLFNNSGRVYGLGLSAVTDLFTTTKLTGHKVIADGIVTAGTIAMLYQLVENNKIKKLYIGIPMIAIVAVYLLFGSESYGWYRIPLYPFVCGSLAVLLIDNLRNLWLLLVTSLLALGPSVSVLLSNISGASTVYRTLMLLGLAWGFRKNDAIPKFFGVLIVLTVLGFGIFYNLLIDINWWYRI